MITSIISIKKLNLLCILLQYKFYYITVNGCMYTNDAELFIICLVQQSAATVSSLLTFVRFPEACKEKQQKLISSFFVLYVLYWLYVLLFKSQLSSGHWNSRNQPNARVILLCSTVWCWVTQNTTEFNGFTAIHFPPHPFTAVIAWTW